MLLYDPMYFKLKLENISIDLNIDLCKYAVKKAGNPIRFINSQLIDNENYSDICLKAISVNARAFKYIDSTKISNDNYLYLCNIASKANQINKYSNFIPSSFTAST